MGTRNTMDQSILQTIAEVLHGSAVGNSDDLDLSMVPNIDHPKGFVRVSELKSIVSADADDSNISASVSPNSTSRNLLKRFFSSIEMLKKLETFLGSSGIKKNLKGHQCVNGRMMMGRTTRKCLNRGLLLFLQLFIILQPISVNTLRGFKN